MNTKKEERIKKTKIDDVKQNKINIQTHKDRFHSVNPPAPHRTCFIYESASKRENKNKIVCIFTENIQFQLTDLYVPHENGSFIVTCYLAINGQKRNKTICIVRNEIIQKS